jgi:hypothetical protein
LSLLVDAAAAAAGVVIARRLLRWMFLAASENQ